jgi:hypothetical protein
MQPRGSEHRGYPKTTIPLEDDLNVIAPPGARIRERKGESHAIALTGSGGENADFAIA